MAEPTAIYRTREPRQMATPRRAVKVTDGNFALFILEHDGREEPPIVVEVRISELGEIEFGQDGVIVKLQVIQ
jgi:hypothetical protein